MRLLVTGNLGYLGSVMTPFLVKHGHEILGLDTGYYRDCLLGEPLASCVSRQITKDIRQVEVNDLTGVEAVVHLAALSNDPTGELNPAVTEDINTVGSLRLAEAAIRAGVRRFVFASSCSIYGHGGESALTEEASFNPLTAYARSKVDTEANLSRLASPKFSPVFLRNGTAYGFSPRLRFDLAVNNLTGWGFTTGQVRLLSDGRAWRPMVHAEDICRAVAAVLEAPRDHIHNQAFNIGVESENHQIRDIAAMVAEVVPDCVVTYADGASADSRTYNVSFAKARRLLPGFVPQWTVREGIEHLYTVLKHLSVTQQAFESRLYTRLKQLRHLMDERLVDESLYWREPLTHPPARSGRRE
jgi:nucleoside-diphosphate-sugar epimerase